MKRSSNSHRWTQSDMTALIRLWGDNEPVEEIANAFKVSVPALNKIVTKLRNSGVPLNYRKRGNRAGRSGKLWSQSEIEYLARRREERISALQIASEMNRTPYAIHAMIAKLRNESVPIARVGQGVRRLYDTEALRMMYSDPTSAVFDSSKDELKERLMQ